MPLLHELSETQKAEVIQRYEAAAASDSADYSALQCAAYNEENLPGDDARLAVQILLEAYQQQGIDVLKKELSYANGKFGEHILHIAMKNPAIFKDCCHALEKAGLLETLFLKKMLMEIP